jgi:taurine dioxygenase
MAEGTDAATERLLAAARRRISMVDPQRAAALRDGGAILVDTRPEAQRRIHGTIPGAIVIDRNVLEWRIDPNGSHRDSRVATDRPLVVFCQQGYASSLAVAALVDIGVGDVHDLAGGFDAWRTAGLPIDGGSPASSVAIEPVTATIGAEVRGVALATITDDDVAAMRGALLRHRVVFVRDQHLTPVQLAAFARRFAELIDDPDGGFGPGWRTDGTFTARPPAAVAAAAEQAPEHGGDTLWADLVAAYDALSESRRTMLDPLVALHDDGGARGPVPHPVVRVHPETGERAVFVNPTYTRRIEGVSAAESDRLLDLLAAHLAAPERTVRWRWRAGDVVVWDNRVTAHYTVVGADPGERRWHRVAIAGDRPRGHA